MDIKDKILNNKVAVHCTTESEAIGFMKWCRENEIKWTNGEVCSDKSCEWDTYKEDTCYDIVNKRLYFADKEHYEDEHCDIVPYQDLIQPLTATVIKVNGTNRDIADRCRTTVGMDVGEGEPSPEYMKKLYMSEHSPIRVKHFIVRIENLPYWIAMHFRTHKIGVEHFIRTQRTDRTGSNTPRDELPQGTLVTMDMELNPQSCISISRKRLCGQASAETRKVWKAVVDAISKVDRPLAECCVPECLYRGFCTEMKPCNYNNTKYQKNAINTYRGFRID